MTFNIWLFYVLLNSSIVSIWTAFAPTLRYPLSVPMNKIILVNATCDSENLNVSVLMQSPFKGLIFAKDFAQECKSVGRFSDELKIGLPTSGCGVRLTSVHTEEGSLRMVYSVNLIIQQDRHLRQISDQEKVVYCDLKDIDLSFKSKALIKTLKQEIKGGKLIKRIGRMKDEGWSKELDGKQLQDEIDEALSAARAWMEIVSENDDDRASDTLQVGETASLIVKSTLPVGIGWRVIECFAHDGLGDSSQKLSNEQGCPIDELLMPAFIYGPIRPMALMQHQEAITRFPAFKFPDRDRLHLSCGLQVCKGECPKVSCGNDLENNTRKGKTFSDITDGVVIDRFEVFNSVEVLAPEIDDLRSDGRIPVNDPEMYPFTNLPGDRTFCVSQDKMAIAFCILGMIFLIAIVISACSLIKTKKDGNGFPSYSRSLFSGSSTSGSVFGSKLLLRDTPSLRHSSSSHSRGMQYGRIL
ncbi:uncharacterized protein LOC130445231 [Diorhabda sublineata]|uniref:uncharacterized protein LOC130445231 n=1 Tax=Diorhabda sublineata TaxID=1163346 RepID=UPI0024E08CB0|nr:uncharacterized protein LOC130445231 [Diorhabda sublineata]